MMRAPHINSAQLASTQLDSFRLDLGGRVGREVSLSAVLSEGVHEAITNRNTLESDREGGVLGLG